MAATGLYYLDGLDMYTTYGFVPGRGCSNDILRPRKAKERYSNDWAEDDGKEWDLSEAPKFEDKEIKLKGHIVCIGQTDFWSKYNALISVFDTPGTHVLRCNEFDSNRNLYVFYKDTTNFDRLTRVKISGPVAIAIEILLQEVQNG